MLLEFLDSQNENLKSSTTTTTTTTTTSNLISKNDINYSKNIQENSIVYRLFTNFDWFSRVVVSFDFALRLQTLININTENWQSNVTFSFCLVQTCLSLVVINTMIDFISFSKSISIVKPQSLIMLRNSTSLTIFFVIIEQWNEYFKPLKIISLFFSCKQEIFCFFLLKKF